MAAIQSLGLLEPSALPYLITEGLLDAAASASSYEWNYQYVVEGNSYVTDEILKTTGCVVWSRNGIVKRVFNLDIENEAITRAFTTFFDQTIVSSEPLLNSGGATSGTNERALVVILKTQAHIFLLSGDTHILPLAFEVESAVPAAFGFFLQRRVSEDLLHGSSVSNEDNNAALTSAQQADGSAHPLSHKLSRNVNHNSLATVPRTFACTELLSELSLVVAGSSRKHESFDAYPVVSSDEEIIYSSTCNELHGINDKASEQVYLAVSVNKEAGTITLWQVLYSLHGHERAEWQRHKIKPGKRKSSNVYGRQNGAITPSARGAGTFRESIGALAPPILETSVFPSVREPQTSQIGDLAAQLGHEFEQVGVQTRSARRISSMLARTDLGGANDRSAFNDMAVGSLGRKSFGRSFRRGESLGGFSDRQSFGTRRRSSFQAASSVYSDGTSFLDIPASHLLDDGTGLTGLDALDNTADSANDSRLPRHVAFMKLKSISYDAGAGGHEASTQLKVMTMIAPDRSTADDRRSRIISVCVMDRKKRELTIVNVAAKVALSSNKHKLDRVSYDLKAVEVHRGQSIVDTCCVTEDEVKRLLILTQTREGRSVLHLEAPWTVSFRVNMPTQLKVFDMSSVFPETNPANRRDVGIRRVIPNSDINISGLTSCEFKDQVLVHDHANRCHRVQFQMLPRQLLVRQILRLCNLVLAPEFYDSILVVWWEVKRWIESQNIESDIEWTALVVTLFVLAVPFISNLQSRPAQGPRRKKGGLLRSSSGTAVDLSSWQLMQDSETRSSCRSGLNKTSWLWSEDVPQLKSNPKSPSKHSRTISTEAADDTKINPFLILCTNMARDFLQSPAGETAIGPEGYLPTAVNKDRASRRTALASILVGLHLLHEEQKLHTVISSLPGHTSQSLAPVIVQIASWLKWQEWRAEPGQYYHTEIRVPAHWAFETSCIDTSGVPAQPFKPPSIFQHVEKSVHVQQHDSFPSLVDLVSQTKQITQNHPLWAEAVRITPRLFAITTFLTQLNLKKPAGSIIKSMLKCGIEKQVLETLPAGVVAICHQAIVTVREQRPIDWPPDVKHLIGRADLDVERRLEDTKASVQQISHVHDALRDHRAISNNAIEADSISRWDAFSELDRQALTRLIFHEDRRFQEASKLVNQTRPPTVDCQPEPGWSEADLLEAQKELAVHVTRRTLSVATGRAMMHFNARVPLLTERVPIPAFSLQCVMKLPGSNDNSQSMTLSADKALFTEDKVCWAFFHNGASAGLMISKRTRWIDTSWILYNKPPELTNRHAGFLLALGLNGHLKSLAKWVAFKYLTPKHTMTSIGLLLGLAASYLGTMDTLIARLLSVHVTRLLPVGAAELNLSPLTQTTGIMGVGLLYYNSQHRRMSEIMLSEIENNEPEERAGDEPILHDEGYRLAAGFSLGLINLGRGRQLHSLHDVGVVERLLTIATGTKNVNLVHVLDRATAGAVIAVAFIYMKTNDDTIAQKIDIPDTAHQFDYVRPDIFLLRTLARHLIMWDRITPTKDFVRTSLPAAFRKRADLATTKRLSTDDLPFFNVMAGICFAMSLRFAGSHRSDVRDLLVSHLDQFLRLTKLPALNYDAKVTLNSVRNCLDVLALSCATVMAGSGDIIVMRRLRALHNRTDKETPFGSHLAAHMALGVLFLSGGTATFGTSDLAIASLVISLYPLFPVDVLDNKGHLQALRHLWVLAVEERCLVARDVETQHIIGDLQAEVISTKGIRQVIRTPGLLPAFESVRKVMFRHESYWPVEVDFEVPASQRTNTRHHQSHEKPNQPTREWVKKNGTGLQISLQRRTVYDRPDADIFFSELQALDESRYVPSIDTNAMVNEEWRQRSSQGPGVGSGRSGDPLDWVFGLRVFRHLGFAEQALVRGKAAESTASGSLLQGTVVDEMLELRHSTSDLADNSDDYNNDATAKEIPATVPDKDKLWQLRLLFSWAESWDQQKDDNDDDENGTGHSPYLHANGTKESVQWMKKEFIEELRWRIWKMSGQ